MASRVLSTIRSRVPCRTSVLALAMGRRGPPVDYQHKLDVMAGRLSTGGSPDPLFHFHGNGNLRVLPLQHQVGAILAGLLQRNPELFDSLFKRPFLHAS